MSIEALIPKSSPARGRMAMGTITPLESFAVIALNFFVQFLKEKECLKLRVFIVDKLAVSKKDLKKFYTFILFSFV